MKIVVYRAPEYKTQARRFVQQMDLAFKDDKTQRSFIKSLKHTVDPMMYAFDDLRDWSEAVQTLTPDVGKLPARMVTYGHEGKTVKYQFERLAEELGSTSTKYLGYTDVQLHGRTIPVKAGAPVSREDCELVATQQFREREDKETVTIGAGAEASKLISDLSSGAADRILFCTTINAPVHSHQWQEELRHFAIAMNSSIKTKKKDWSRVRFVITCPEKMNPKALEQKRQEIITQVNASLEPLNIQLNDRFFVMQSHTPDNLPLNRREEFANLFPEPDSPSYEEETEL